MFLSVYTSFFQYVPARSFAKMIKIMNFFCEITVLHIAFVPGTEAGELVELLVNRVQEGEGGLQEGRRDRPTSLIQKNSGQG
jgi:hypothetical protein